MAPVTVDIEYVIPGLPFGTVVIPLMGPGCEGLLFTVTESDRALL